MDPTDDLTIAERLVVAQQLKALSARTIADSAELLEASRRLISVAKAEAFLSRPPSECDPRK